MNYKIGVFDSSASENEQNSELIQKAKMIGETLGKLHCTVITGACKGLPYIAAQAAREKGAKIRGFSPTKNIQEHKKYNPHDDASIYSEIAYIPTDFSLGDTLRIGMKYRNVISTAHCDGGIVISGRWGSLNEFTNLMDMGKVIGVLTGTGGIADELPGLYAKIHKEGQGTVLFDSDPEILVTKVVATLAEKI